MRGLNIQTLTKQKLLSLAEERAENGTTFCPSEAARAVNPESWREDMDFVREVADDLVQSNQLEVLQKGVVITQLPSEAKGPIRLRKKVQ